MTFLCLAGYEKGHEFLREAKRQGGRVLLLSSLKLKDTAQWPVESLDDIFYMPDKDHEWDRGDTVKAVSYLARTSDIDRVVALDDFDVEMGATLREHLRLPGIGETQARFFRDKLAMRMRAQDAGIAVPRFVGIFQHHRVHEFMEQVPGPWVLKPRSLAGAIGIKKIHSQHELWAQLELIGDMQSHYLLERFVPGDVFHVDTLMNNGKIVFASVSGYGRPPMEVSHGGGVFTTRILERGCEDSESLFAANQKLLSSFGLVHGVSHTEFIKAHEDGEIYFLETSARVGGAHIADLVEAATGVNMWAEWAKLEAVTADKPYSPPLQRFDYSGLLVSLAREECPDTRHYGDSEIVWRMQRPYHVGLIFRSPSHERISQLLSEYAGRVQHEFGAVLPPRDKPDA